jgi:hypothetical protein
MMEIPMNSRVFSIQLPQYSDPHSRLCHAGSAGRQIILVPTEVPHKFMDLGDK